MSGDANITVNELILFLAASNSVRAGWLTLTLAGMFGEKKSLTNKRGYFVVSKWRGDYYMLDYNPAEQVQP